MFDQQIDLSGLNTRINKVEKDLLDTNAMSERAEKASSSNRIVIMEVENSVKAHQQEIDKIWASLKDKVDCEVFD